MLSDEELVKVPVRQQPFMRRDNDGKFYVTRSHVVQFSIGIPLSEVTDKVNVLYGDVMSSKR